MKKKGKHKSTTGIGASLFPNYREKEESNNMFPIKWHPKQLHHDFMRQGSYSQWQAAIHLHKSNFSKSVAIYSYAMNPEVKQ